MSFQSILYEGTDGRRGGDQREDPGVLADLNLDQIIDAIVGDSDQGHLRRIFLKPLATVEAIRYRQQVMIDLESRRNRQVIDAFAEDMRKAQDSLALSERIFHAPQKQRWFLDAVEAYCHAVAALSAGLSVANLKSGGLTAFCDYLSAYLSSDRFQSLRAAAQKLKADLSAIRYCLLIRDNRVTVRPYAGEADLGADLSSVFTGFERIDVGEGANPSPVRIEMNQLEARILDSVTHLFPEIFAALEEFCAAGRSCLDEKIMDFEADIGFYRACLDFTARFRPAGLSFCYPRLSATNKTVSAEDAFDLALAIKLVREEADIVRNDFSMQGRERVFVVTGPNQGGKTTFARTFGQLHYLARLGCPVPGRDAQLFLCDRMLTHFEREEKVEDRSGKLEDDLVRIRLALEAATPDSIIILNEIFSSTTLTDARFLGEKVLHDVIALDALCVYVTFVDELATLDEKIVSLVSEAIAEDDAARTFKIRRRPADGLAFAQSLARRHRLTSADIAERLQR